jgi:thymidylate kinase
VRAGAGHAEHGRRLTVSAPREDRLELHPLLRDVFAALDRAGVRWCLLRGPSGTDMQTGDVDLLVAREDAAPLTGAITPLGFARLPACGYGSHRFHLGYDAATDRWLKLDVVTELAFGPWFSLPSEAAAHCLSRRRRLGSAAVLDDGDAFWCLLLHRMLDKGSVGAAAAPLARLARAPGCAESPLAREVERIAPGSCTPALLLDAARRAAWTELEARGPFLAVAWRRRHRVASLRRRVMGRVARSASPFLRSRRGMTVALVGPDGAGKSSSAAALALSFPLAVRTVYMSPAMTPRRGSSLRGARLALRIGAQLSRWCRAQALRLRGRLVLFDRYAYDALLPARWPLGHRGRLRRWLLGHICPAPQLIVVLDAPGELLHARTGEHDPAVLEAERRAYLRLARDRARAIVVDATREPDRVRRDITAAIWTAYRSRWACRQFSLTRLRRRAAV